MVLSKAALLSLAALPATQAFFLIPCWPLSTQRLDPIVYPGEPASHLHSIVGGKAFAPVMDYNTTQTSECTTCMVSKDKSNYWVASLFHQNGDSFELVPQHGSASLYYLNEKTRLGSGEKMEPLPVGLRMLAGDPEKRSGTSLPRVPGVPISFELRDMSNNLGHERSIRLLEKLRPIPNHRPEKMGELTTPTMRCPACRSASDAFACACDG